MKRILLVMLWMLVVYFLICLYPVITNRAAFTSSHYTPLAMLVVTLFLLYHRYYQR